MYLYLGLHSFTPADFLGLSKHSWIEMGYLIFESAIIIASGLYFLQVFLWLRFFLEVIFFFFFLHMLVCKF